MRCPACLSDRTDRTGLAITPEQAANYLVPPRRSPERNRDLVDVLVDLWGEEGATIDVCNDCGFGFSNPFVAGTQRVYNSIGDGAQHYPRDRFEFGATIDSLRRRGAPVRLLEVGAGAGAFQRELRSEGLIETTVATEYDRAAIASLRRIRGLTVVEGDFRDAVSELGTFDAICLFQVLEHLDDVDRTFATLGSLLRPGGSVFLGVPNHERIGVQESLTGLLDMPPQHIGRWTPNAMRAAAHRHGFHVVEERARPARAFTELWGLAKYREEARARRPSTLVSHVERIRYRPLRGLLKRGAAVWDLLLLARHYGSVPSDTRWFRLDQIRAGD